MTDDEIPVLSFDTDEVEPEDLPSIRVELGGDIYTARCPNDFEFVRLAKMAGEVEQNPGALDVEPMVRSFFQTSDAYAILRNCEGEKPKIRFVGELDKCLLALMDHYGPMVEKRLKQTQKSIAPKK